MKKSTCILFFAFLNFIVLFFSCNVEDEKNVLNKNHESIKRTLNTLLKSIENRNIDSLKSTMPPSGKIELILPDTKITYTVKEFVELHKNWFEDKNWTITTNILNIESGKYIGTATTEAIYKEPNRNGKPYTNHIIVSYVLKKENNGNWYVIKDHACSLKKSTD